MDDVPCGVARNDGLDLSVLEPTAQAVWFEGNYDAYETDKKRRLGAEADQPHRIRYKKLTKE